jgi:hypothetical protein
MAFDFPASPTTGQVFTPAGGPSYVWNGYAWAQQSSIVPALVLLNTLVANNSPYLTDQVSFTPSYDSYEIEFQNVTPVVTACLQAQVFSGGSWVSGTFYNTMVWGSYQGGITTGSGWATDASSAAAAFFISGLTNLFPVNASTPLSGFNGRGLFNGINTPGAYKYFTGNGTHLTTGGSAIQVVNFGGYVATGVITGIRFFFNNNNISSGTIRIYGRKSS